MHGEDASESGGLRPSGAPGRRVRWERGTHMSRSRWIKRAFAGVLALSAAAGCKQQLFMEPADYNEAIKVAPPKSLEYNVHGPIVPSAVDKMGPLTDVVNFTAPPRHMTLRECIAIA